ncbi:SDR family NAD(P)-dependent oxidoreductase [Ruegeria sp. 2012CJ41-6]|uniref:SDR family NAD(P)-dependent oxidoreductase n=1 Tax=Ruegeria spongiae TaxID=2942209 RepID=A0ABT0Q6X0_9RHOB|nr:type I polyketide synthase [Ruegeria spongiae]MCL6285137.1 SDR family NAD(P)-dependent oxidoreductase [Ruegeria spongiae]
MTVATKSENAVAIIGMGLRFPGGAESVQSYWDLLVNGINAVGEIPADRMDVGQLYSGTPATPGRIMTRFGGFLDNIDAFDAGFFGISPREAERMDPQQRLVLETAWHAIEDAQIDAHSLSGRRVGVYVGQWLSDFEARLMRHPENTDFEMTVGSGRYTTAGRLSYFLGLEGPSLTLDTACSSSLTAVHLAVQSLRSGESELAFAAGVNAILSPHITVGYSQSRMMAPDGRCKFGDASGDGYVRSEGAGMVLLKRLDHALEDGDQIRAVIRGSAINNDGRNSGFMGRPAIAGQKSLIGQALSDAQVPSDQIGYVEAHGTGTATGDPVELTALGETLGAGRATSQPLYVGSVKTNIGHTEGAAGLAGLLKASLAVQTGIIPASLNMSHPNPKIDWDGLNLAVPVAPVAWAPEDHRRRAAISSFGIAGSNAQIIVEEPPKPTASPVEPAMQKPLVLPLSAACKPGLQALARTCAALIETESATTIGRFCSAMALGRTALRERAVFVGSDRLDLIASLKLETGGGSAIADGSVSAIKPKIVFVAPGQGGQWTGMSRELYASEPAFRNKLDECDSLLADLVDWSLLAQLNSNPGDDAFLLDRIDVIQPALVALAIAYAALWQAKGVKPDAVVGHSMGEVAAAAIAGSLDLKSAFRIVVHRSQLMARTSGTGGMALVELDPDAISARLRSYRGELSLAARNGPRNCIISGEISALERALNEFERDGIFCRRVKVDVASHSPQMEPLANELSKDLANLVPRHALTPMYSTVQGALIDGTALDNAYWAKNLRQPVLFHDALVQAIGGHDAIVVELGPHPVLLPAIIDTARDLASEVASVGTTLRDEPEGTAFLTSLATLWTKGVSVEWDTAASVNRGAVHLPPYPWQKKRHWLEEAELSHATDNQVGPSPLDAETLSCLYSSQWVRTEADPDKSTQSGTRWLIVGASSNFAVNLTAQLGRFENLVRCVGIDEFTVLDQMPDRVVVLGFGENTSPFLPLEVLQRLTKCNHYKPPRLFFVAKGAHPVTSDEPELDTDQAAFWGAARVVASEHPELSVRLIDLDPQSDASEAAGDILIDLFSTESEDQIAYRKGHRYGLRMRAGVDRLPNARAPWRSDAACLITGGLGGVGGRIALVAARQGARHIVLMGRSVLPVRSDWKGIDPASVNGARIRLLREIEAAGSSVHYIQADVSSKPSLDSALRSYECEARPPIKTVVHAAGQVRNGLSADLSADQFDEVLEAKYRGAQNLDALLSDLDLFVVFSSVAHVFAPAGMANYVAANAAVEALATKRQTRGQPAIYIGWSVWPGVGSHAEGKAASDSTELERLGVRAMAPEQSEAIFAWLCRNRASATVMNVDWTTYGQTTRGQPAPLFDQLAGETRAAPSEVSKKLAELDAASRKELLVEFIRDNLGAILKSDPVDIDPQRALGSFGLNSLMGIELRNRLEAALDRALPATLIWNHPTVAALASHLAGGPPRSTSPRSNPAPAVQPAQMDGLDDLMSDLMNSSDDDVYSALRKPKRDSSG